MKSSEPIFYVYAYTRSKKSKHGDVGTFYYVGKGFGRRAFTTHHKGISVPKDRDNIVLLKENLTEEQSQELEKQLIQKLGRIDLRTGILQNKTNGGEGSTGKIVKSSSVEKGKQTKLSKYGTLNFNTLENRRKATRTKILNGTLKPTVETIEKIIAAKRKNGTLSPTREQINRAIETRKKNGTRTCDPEIIAKSNRTREINGTLNSNTPAACRKRSLAFQKRRALGITNKPRPKYPCPYCSRQIDATNILRHSQSCSTTVL